MEATRKPAWQMLLMAPQFPVGYVSFRAPVDKPPPPPSGSHLWRPHPPPPFSTRGFPRCSLAFAQLSKLHRTVRGSPPTGRQPWGGVGRGGRVPQAPWPLRASRCSPHEAARKVYSEIELLLLLSGLLLSSSHFPCPLPPCLSLSSWVFLLSGLSASARASDLLASLGHTGRGRALLGHTLNISQHAIARKSHPVVK